MFSVGSLTCRSPHTSLVLSYQISCFRSGLRHKPCETSRGHTATGGRQTCFGQALQSLIQDISINVQHTLLGCCKGFPVSGCSLIHHQPCVCQKIIFQQQVVHILQIPCVALGRRCLEIQTIYHPPRPAPPFDERNVATHFYYIVLEETVPPPRSTKLPPNHDSKLCLWRVTSLQLSCELQLEIRAVTEHSRGVVSLVACRMSHVLVSCGEKPGSAGSPDSLFLITFNDLFGHFLMPGRFGQRKSVKPWGRGP